jgi:hypothetical protein
MATQPGPYGSYPPPGGNPPGKKRTTGFWVRTWIVGICVLALVVILLVTAIRDSGSGSGGSSGSGLGSGGTGDPAHYQVYWAAGPVKQYATDVPGLTPSAAPTDATLSQVDPRGLYWAMLKRQSMKSVTDYIHLHYLTEDDYRSDFVKDMSTSVNAERIGIDYRSRSFIADNGQISPEGKGVPHQAFTRCVQGGGSQFYIPGNPWQVSKDDTAGLCADRMKPDKIVANALTADSIATGNLSNEEADKFLSYLDGIPGLFTMDKPSAAQGTDGKTYIQLDVTLKQVDAKSDSEPGAAKGMAFLNAAFGQTGKDPDAYPYSIDHSPDEGLKVRYYLDPATLLPAYSIMKTLPAVTTSGAPASGASPSEYFLYEYAFPQQLDPAAMQATGEPTMPIRPWPFKPTVLN